MGFRTDHGSKASGAACVVGLLSRYTVFIHASRASVGVVKLFASVMFLKHF
jgi:hypothetical protein